MRKTLSLSLSLSLSLPTAPVPLPLSLSLSQCMKSSIRSALASVREVAVFAWSLLELLLTRILPLLGFLAAHFLLHCCRLLASTLPSALSASRRRARNLFSPPRKPRLLQAPNHNEQQQQPCGYLRRPDGAITTTTALYIEEILNDFVIPEKPEASTETALPSAIAPTPAVHLSQTPDLQADGLSAPPPSREQTAISAAAAALQAFDALPTGLRPAPRNEEQSVVPSAAVLKASDPRTVGLRPSTSPSNGEQIAIYDKHIHDGRKQEQRPDLFRYEQYQSADAFIVHEATEPGVDGSNLYLANNNVEESKTGSSKLASGSIKRPPFTRVLPPSLSQIKRTLMQRSRRNSSSPPLKSSLNMKRQSPRNMRKLTSAMKSSPSYDNFIRNFRKHFLLDSPDGPRRSGLISSPTTS